ncbi:hypothetical protein ACTXKW_26170, partial [Pseudomonas helleri]
RRSPQQDADRLMEIFMVEVMGVVLVLVFVERNQDGLAISLRRAQTRRENTVQTRTWRAS